MAKKKFCNRREFLGAAAVFTIVPRYVLGGEGHTPPSEKLNIAGIGVGGMGKNNLTNMTAENIVALCDVDWEYAGKVFNDYPQAKTYKDYRVMLEKHKDIDAVLIATPDHTHAVITLAALQAGKHVYCQKPLTHDIYEARRIAEAAKQARVVTQMGNQYRSSQAIPMLSEWMADGAIGEVREVDAWCALKYRPFGHKDWSPLMDHRPTEKPEVPKTLDWDLWIGPAAYRDYHPTYHPRKWRAWWEFGTGMMCDRGVHTLDSTFSVLNLSAPSTVELIRKEGDTEEIHPDIAIVRYTFPARGAASPVAVNWYSGMEPPRPEELEPERQMGDKEGGVIFKGDKGKIMDGTYPKSPRIIPEARMQQYKLPAKTLPRITVTHEQNWIECCKSGKQASSDFSYGAALTEFALLGNLAIKLGGKIEWDSKNLKAVGRPEADEWIRRPYRPGWSL